MGICNSICAYYYSDCSTYYRNIIATIPIERFLRARWMVDKEIRSLRYLWKKVEIVVRKVHWITLRSNPRWGAGRWKAKT